MKQAFFRRVFGKSLFQPLDLATVLVLGTDQKLWIEHAPFGDLPRTRQQIDDNVAAFDAVDENNVYVLDTDGNLWLELGPFGPVPPPRQPVDFGVVDFDPIDVKTIFVLGKDGNLWLENGPFHSVPPNRQQVDGNVAAFDAIDANTIYVLGKNGNLWLERGPFTSVPPNRQQVDGNVAAFGAIDASHIYVLGSNAALWLAQGPFDTVPPSQQQVDVNVAAFSQLGANGIYVLGLDRKLWLENGPFNSVPPPRQQVDGDVAAFDPVDGENLYVLGSDGKLWLENGPFGTIPPRRTLVDTLELTNPCTACGQLSFTAIPSSSGINANIATTGLPSLLIVCSGPFSISGFSWPATPVGGQRQTVINASNFTMTILSQDTSSTLGNRISTPTGKPVTLAPSPSGAENAVSFEYDGKNGEWVLVEQLGRATPEDGLFYVSAGPKAADSNDGLSPGTPFKTIQQALISLGYTTSTLFSFPVTMISGTTVTFGMAVTLPAGIPVCFAVQPNTYYYLASAINASTTGTLTIAFPASLSVGVSPTNPTTVSPGVGNPGSIVLFGGNFYAPPGGLVLGPHQSIEGVGATASRIVGSWSTSGNGNPVLCLTGSESAARNLFVTVPVTVPPTKDAVGVRVSILFGVLEENPPVYGSNEDSCLQNIYVQMSGIGASTCFGIGDNTTGDVSDVTILGCTANGPFSSSEDDTIFGFYLGGGPGNVLDISVHGGVANGCDYGVAVSGGGCTFWGFNFAHSSKADIWLKSDAIGNVSFHGGRSENAGRFLISDFFAGYQSAKVQDYTVVALHNTDGQGIQLVNGGPIALENIALFGLNCPQYIYMPTRADSDIHPYQVDLASIFCEHPFPLQSAWTRDNQILTTRLLGFVGDSNYETWSRCTTSDQRVKRKNVTPPPTPTSNTDWIVDPIFFDAYEIRLGSKAGVLTLRDGSIGKLITITFEQDGVGGWSYMWPANCAWSGGNAPANVTTSRNRQSCDFRWNGRFWTQCGPVMDIVPPVIARNPIKDKFSTGNPYWLDHPDISGAKTRWEHVPGGGSLGIKGGVCVCNCLGYVGDASTNDNQGLWGPGAAAVIETGMATQPSGISATFVWWNGAGIICHYKDDQTFMVVTIITSTLLTIRGWSNGVLTNYGDRTLDKAIEAGTSHTLIVQCVATASSSALVVSLDGGANTFNQGQSSVTVTLTPVDQKNFGDLTKHGIFAASTKEVFTELSVS
jgi:hypothetical protein